MHITRIPRRTRLRGLGAVLAALMVVGLPTPTLAAASARTPSAASPPACTAAMTKISFRAGQGAAGSIYGHVRLKNVSRQTCTIHGYGGISYVGYGDGTQVGAAAQRTRAKVRTVTLAPGQRARARVQMVEAGNYPRRTCGPTKVDGFRVYLPGETHAAFARYRTTGCANAHVQLLYNKPYRR